MSALRLGTFTRSVLLHVARGTRAFRDAGLEVEELAVPSSPAQFASLDAGEFDAVFTSPDNVIAYRFLTANPLGRILDVRVLAGLDRGLGLELSLRPGLEQPSPGLRFGVDVPNSGFAFVGYALLERAGVRRDRLEIVTLGSTPARAAALLAGDCDATVLGAGNELRARAEGAHPAGAASDLGAYLGTVLACSGVPHPGVSRLAEVLVRTAAAIVDGSLEREAVAGAEEVLGLSPALAAAHVAVLRDPSTGLVPNGAVDAASLRTLVGLRRRFLPDPDLDRVDLDALRPDARD